MVVLRITDMGEMQAIVKEVYGNNFRTSVYAQRIMEKIHKLGGDNGTGEVSREQFNSFAKKHPALLFPAFQMQHALQKRIMGIKFWDSAARKRNKNFGSAMNLQDFLREINEAAFDEMVGHVAGADDYAVTAAHAHNPRAAGVRGAPRTMSSRDLRSVGRKRSSREVLPPGMVLEHPPRRPKKIASTPSMGKKRHPKAQAGGAFFASAPVLASVLMLVRVCDCATRPQQGATMHLKCLHAAIAAAVSGTGEGGCAAFNLLLSPWGAYMNKADTVASYGAYRW